MASLICTGNKTGATTTTIKMCRFSYTTIGSMHSKSSVDNYGCFMFYSHHNDVYCTHYLQDVT